MSPSAKAVEKHNSLLAKVHAQILSGRWMLVGKADSPFPPRNAQSAMGGARFTRSRAKSLFVNQSAAFRQRDTTHALKQTVQIWSRVEYAPDLNCAVASSRPPKCPPLIRRKPVSKLNPARLIRRNPAQNKDEPRLTAMLLARVEEQPDKSAGGARKRARGRPDIARRVLAFVEHWPDTGCHRPGRPARSGVNGRLGPRGR